MLIILEKKPREISIAGKWWMGVQNESSDKYTCIDCNVSYFFGVSYKFTSCTIFTRELVAAWLVAEMENHNEHGIWASGRILFQKSSPRYSVNPSFESIQRVELKGIAVEI